MEPLKIFIGHDPREEIAWQVCRHSILRHYPDARVHPLRQEALRELGLYVRPPDQAASTAFSLTRFLVPFLAAHDGWSLFADCDILFTTDLRRILDGADPAKAVHVVQHDYVPRLARKMDGQVQSGYPRKNWSSVMLFRGSHPAVRALTPAVVNTATPAFLHRLEWAGGDGAIGALDPAWNFLVGEYAAPARLPFGIHFTNGGPWFAQTPGGDYAELWNEERRLWEAARSARPPPPEN